MTSGPAAAALRIVGGLSSLSRNINKYIVIVVTKINTISEYDTLIGLILFLQTLYFTWPHRWSYFCQQWGKQMSSFTGSHCWVHWIINTCFSIENTFCVWHVWLFFFANIQVSISFWWVVYLFSVNNLTTQQIRNRRFHFGYFSLQYQ